MLECHLFNFPLHFSVADNLRANESVRKLEQNTRIPIEASEWADDEVNCVPYLQWFKAKMDASLFEAALHCILRPSPLTSRMAAQASTAILMLTACPSGLCQKMTQEEEEEER